MDIGIALLIAYFVFKWLILLKLDRIAKITEKSLAVSAAEHKVDSEAPLLLSDVLLEQEQKRLAEKYPGIEAHIYLPALRR